jgi:mRNA-degrading endonuclease RelE of RelBE toxin-antitoxin system
MIYKFNSYTIKTSEKFQKLLRDPSKIPKQHKKVFEAKLKIFKINPCHNSLNTKKLKISPEKLHELQIDEA